MRCLDILAKTLKLGSVGKAHKHVRIVVGKDGPVFPKRTIESPDAVTWHLGPVSRPQSLLLQVMQVTSELCEISENVGRVMLHSGLAVHNGYGVCIAGPGGIGKTTTLARLPESWLRLCDDACVIVRDKNGAYWAHPWPTWSRLLNGASGLSWDVQRAVPLKGIFFLQQGRRNRVERLKRSQAVCMLVECAEQVSIPFKAGMDLEEVRRFRLKRFDTVFHLVKAIPVYLMHIARRGRFWELMEDEVKRSTRVEPGSGAESRRFDPDTFRGEGAYVLRAS